MADVSPLTNAVNENIEQTLADIRTGAPPSVAITGMVLRDVYAMIDGGPVQGQHFADCGEAWFGHPVESVAATYREMHEAYRSGWIQIAAALGCGFQDERELDDVVRLQTSISENIAMQAKNNALRSAEDDARGMTKALMLLFAEKAATQ